MGTLDARDGGSSLEGLYPRLRSKAYGRRFIASLPPAPLVQSFAPIEAFFSNSANGGEEPE